MSLTLRALNPQTERHLFEQSYNWRRNPRRNRMAFEDFAKDDPSQIVLGLFNGELQAVYLFCQISSTRFDAHFTSSRSANRTDVLAGARALVEWFTEQGLEVIGHVQARNGPLRAFLRDAGLYDTGCELCYCQNDTDGVSSCHHKTFVEFRSAGEPQSG